MPTLFPELMLKVAAGPSEHASLERIRGRAEGVKPNSWMGNARVKANTASDKGLSHPFIPGSEHGFKNLHKVRKKADTAHLRATRRLAKATKGGWTGDVRRVMATDTMGRASHRVDDTFFHGEKPKELISRKGQTKRLSGLRAVLPSRLRSGLEHRHSGLRKEKWYKPPEANLDRIDTSYKADRRALQHAETTGKKNRERLVSSVMKQRGVDQASAESMVRKLHDAPAPRRSAKIVGKAGGVIKRTLLRRL